MAGMTITSNRLAKDHAYTYRSLVEGPNIRVLRLHGASTYDEILSFDLVEVSLSSAPNFYAISYCWEKQRPSRQVLCDGQILSVTVNCEAALKQFRLHKNETIFLWIDMVCINQAKSAVYERNSQVCMMGDIYATAAQTWVWLGLERLTPLSQQSSTMLNWLKELAEAGDRNDLEQRQTAVTKVALDFQPMNLCYLYNEIPWFRRVWVLQEVVMSKIVVIYRDHVRFCYHGIVKAAEVMTDLQERIPELTLHGNYLTGNFRMFLRLEKVKSGGKLSSLLHHVFSGTRMYLSKDPRDKVFALNAFFNTNGRPLPAPDYANSVATVYRHTMKAIISSDNTLSSLKQVNGMGNNFELSSWSPDWSVSKYPLYPSRLSGPEFRASGHSSPAFSFSEDCLFFRCSGRPLESISSCAEVAVAHTSERFGEAKDYLAWSRNLQPEEGVWKELLTAEPELSESILKVWNISVVKNLCNFISMTADFQQTEAETQKHIFAYGMSYARAIFGVSSAVNYMHARAEWKSIIIGESPHGSPQQPFDNQELDNKEKWAGETEISEFLSHKEKLKHSSIATILQTPEFRTWEAICRDRNAAAVHHLVTSGLCYQTYFRTSSTNALGIAPQSVREGDIVALLAGLEVPMIIRALDNGHYRMIAPAFVCGIMEGEAWDGSRGNENALRELVFE